MKKSIPFIIIAVLIIAAVVAGGFYLYRSPIEETNTKTIEIDKSPEVDALPPEPTQSDSPEEPAPGLAAEEPIIQPVEPEKDDHELSVTEKIIREADRYYRKLDWDKALEKLEPLLSAEVDPVIQKQGQELKTKCRTFRKLLADIPRQEMALLVDLVRIDLISGRFLEGQLLEKTGRGLRVRLKGFTGEVPFDQIDSYEAIDPERRKLQLKKEYNQRLELLAKDSTAHQYYQLAVFCYKNELREEVVSMLEKAWKKSDNIIAIVQEEEVVDLYESYLFYREYRLQTKMDETRQRLEAGFPKSEYLAKIKELPDLASVPIALEPVAVNVPADNTGSTNNSDPSDSRAAGPSGGLKRIVRDDEAQKFIDEADKIYAQGHKHFVKTKKYGPDFESENEKAYLFFRKAVRLYQKAEKLRPDDLWLRQRFNEVIQMARSARRQKKLKKKDE